MRFSTAAAAERLLPMQLASRVRPMLNGVDAVLFARDDRGSAGRTSLTAFSIRVFSAAIAFLSQVLLARWLGGFDYGIFVLVWTTMIIIGNLTCLGFHTSVVRFIPEYRGNGDLARLRGVMAASRTFVLVTSTLLTGFGAIIVWLVAGHIESYYVIPFLLGILCLPMIALSDTLEGISRANSWAMSSLGPIYILRPLLILAALGAALLMGYEPDAQTALLATIFATYATTLFQVATVTVWTRGEVAGTRPLYQWRLWLAVSLPIFLIEGFFFLLTNADVLMVGYFMSPDDVAIYFATVKTLALVHFVYFAVKAGAAQRYAQYAHGGHHERLASFARETVSWTFWPSLAMALAVLAIGKPMLMLFGPGFDAGYPLLFVLMVGVVARAAVGPAESLLSMSGHQNLCALVLGITLTINIGLNIALIPIFGLWGAALTTAFAMVCEAVMLGALCWYRLGIVMLIDNPFRKSGVLA